MKRSRCGLRRLLLSLLCVGASSNAYAAGIDRYISGPLQHGLFDAGVLAAVNYRVPIDLSLYGIGTHIKFVSATLQVGGVPFAWSAWAASNNRFMNRTERVGYFDAAYRSGVAVPHVVYGQNGHSFIADILSQQIHVEQMRALEAGRPFVQLTTGRQRSPWDLEGFLDVEERQVRFRAGGITVRSGGAFEVGYVSAVNRDLWDHEPHSPFNPPLHDLDARRAMPLSQRPLFFGALMASIRRLPDGTRLDAYGAERPTVHSATGAASLLRLERARIHAQTMSAASQSLAAREWLLDIRAQGYNYRGWRLAGRTVPRLWR